MTEHERGAASGALALGMPVFDADGNKIGEVSEHGVQDGMLILHHGLFRKDVGVPLHLIRAVDASGVYLFTDEDAAQ